MSDAAKVRTIECSKVEATLLGLALRESQRLEEESQRLQARAQEMSGAGAALWSSALKDVLEQRGEKGIKPGQAVARRIESGAVIIEIAEHAEPALAAANGNGNGHAPVAESPAKKKPKSRIPAEAT